MRHAALARRARQDGDGARGPRAYGATGRAAVLSTCVERGERAVSQCAKSRRVDAARDARPMASRYRAHSGASEAERGIVAPLSTQVGHGAEAPAASGRDGRRWVERYLDSVELLSAGGRDHDARGDGSAGQIGEPQDRRQSGRNGARNGTPAPSPGQQTKAPRHRSNAGPSTSKVAPPGLEPGLS